MHKKFSVLLDVMKNMPYKQPRFSLAHKILIGFGCFGIVVARVIYVINNSEVNPERLNVMNQLDGNTLEWIGFSVLFTFCSLLSYAYFLTIRLCKRAV